MKADINNPYKKEWKKEKRAQITPAWDAEKGDGPNTMCDDPWRMSHRTTQLQETGSLTRRSSHTEKVQRPDAAKDKHQQRQERHNRMFRERWIMGSSWNVWGSKIGEKHKRQD